jgi:hypothetical protein
MSEINFDLEEEVYQESQLLTNKKKNSSSKIMNKIICLYIIIRESIFIEIFC